MDTSFNGLVKEAARRYLGNASEGSTETGGPNWASSNVDAVTGQFTAIGQSNNFTPQAGRGFNISIWGTFEGAIRLERSFDEGVTWIPLWPSEVYEISEVITLIHEEPEANVQYRLNCLSYTSGTVNYRMSQ